MGIERAYASANQRTDIEDFNATNALAQANLALAMRQALAPSYGIIRGGRLLPQAGAWVVYLQGLIAATLSGGSEALVVVDGQVVAIPQNVSGNPRIDTISVSYAETLGSPQDRVFVTDRTTKTTTSTPTPTRVICSGTIHKTIGAPGLNPVAPAAPAGDLLLGYVRTESGVSQIVQAGITNAQDDRAQPIVGGNVTPTDLINASTVSTSEILRLVAPEGAAIFYSGSLTFTSISGATGVPVQVFIRDTLTDVHIATGYGVTPDGDHPITIPVSGFMQMPALGVTSQRLVLGAAFDSVVTGHITGSLMAIILW